MSDGSLFPKKSETGGQEEEAPPIVIERSDDPDFGKTPSRTSGSSLPNARGKQTGCGSSVFLFVLLGVGMLAMVAARVIL